MTHIFNVHIRWHISDVVVVPFLLAFLSYTYYLSSCGVLNILPCYLCPGIQVTGSVSLYFWAFYAQTTLWPFSYLSILVFFIFLLRISVPQHSVSGNRSTFVIKVYYHHGYCACIQVNWSASYSAPGVYLCILSLVLLSMHKGTFYLK